MTDNRTDELLLAATNKLRKLLDERGVEWKDGDAAYEIEWSTPDGRHCSAMYWKPTFTVLMSGCTPEQAIAATLGGDGNSRWHELFGTPERAARTLTNVCQFTHGGELCDRCQCYLFDDCDGMLRLRSEQSIYDALLEWLRGDAE